MDKLDGSLVEPFNQAEIKFYGSIFQTLDPNNSGSVSGGVARPLLEASGLSLPSLGMIWNLADPENNGFLNQYMFCIAMRLIAHAQNGAPITLESANHAAPLAKFQSIKINHTGSGVPVSVASPSPESRVSSVNSSASLSSVTPSPLVPLLSSVQAESFGKMFDKTAAADGILHGEEARNIFLKARLPIQVLERIWAVVDQEEKGELTRPQFIVAMHLIQCFMNKSMTILPTTLSDQLWRVAQGPSVTSSSLTDPTPSPIPASIPSPQLPQSPLRRQSSGGIAASNRTNLNTWIMSNQQKEQYGAIFETLDTSKKGSISSGEVANFLMTSKLTNSVLATIWELANLDQCDDFTKQEFSIAMYLVQKKLAGYELPNETPSELIQSSAFNVQQQTLQPPSQTQPNHQSFDSAKKSSAPQRSASHMDDLLGIFNSASPMAPANPTSANYGSIPSPFPQTKSLYQNAPPAPAPRNSTLTEGRFVPSSNFGKTLVVDSSDDDDGPENLDIPRIRGAPPAIPGRGNKPHFDSSENIPVVSPVGEQLQQVPQSKMAVQPPQSNYDALKTVGSSELSTFNSQPANATSGFTGATGATTAAATTAAAAAAAATIGFTGVTGFNSSSNRNANDITNQLSNTSVDIANYSNQMNSLSQQTSGVTNKKEKAQQELNKMLKTKETMIAKLKQFKAFHENETQQLAEVQNMQLQAKQETDELQKELNVAEASYHAEQTKLEKLKTEYEDSQKKSQLLKEQLGTLNAESIDLKQQIEEYTAKSAQASNIFAVSQQQIAVQEAQNNELKSKIEELKNSIFHIESQHSDLLNRKNALEDESSDLQEKHTDMSVSLAEKSVAFSDAAASAAAFGVGAVTGAVTGALGISAFSNHSEKAGEKEADDEKVNEVQLGTGDSEEIPTASLDDFNEDGFTDSSPVEAQPVASPYQKTVELQSQTSSPEGTNGMSNTIQTETTPTQTAEGSETFTGEQHQSQFALPFNIPHSETSSTQNNPSQSVRGDLDVADSDVSTVSDTASNSRALGQQPASDSQREVGESFELVNHSDASQSNVNAEDGSALAASEHDDVTIDAPSTVVDAPTAQESVSKRSVNEAPSITESIAEDQTSASSDDFQDATNDDAKLAGTKVGPDEVDTTTVSKNPFSRSDINEANSETVTNTDNLFDDLNLEDAALEDDEHETTAYNFEHPAVPTSGFSFSHTGSDNVTSSGADDWEQVFAGFGNDPNLQTKAAETDALQSQFSKQAVPTSFGFTADSSKDAANGELSQSQKLALEELKGMGFTEKDSLSALEKCQWNIDDASNFLLDV